MPIVVPVRFRYAAIDLWFDPVSLPIHRGDHVVVSTERGQEIGLAVEEPFNVNEETLRAPLKPVLRVATEEDLVRADDLAEKSKEAFIQFRDIAENSDLEIKPVACEYLFDGDKIVCYFAADDRVDFRELVRELAAIFKIRVDMRQIGVRDEARLVGGFGHCGQELCCKRFGREFEPVSIRMAKEQDLPLNPLKISGACGRLMCCLRYEFFAYKDFKSRAPKFGALIETPLGTAKVCSFNTPLEEVVLRLENGKQITVPLKSMCCSQEGCHAGQAKSSTQSHNQGAPDKKQASKAQCCGHGCAGCVAKKIKPEGTVSLDEWSKKLDDPQAAGPEAVDTNKPPHQEVSADQDSGVKLEAQAYEQGSVQHKDAARRRPNMVTREELNKIDDQALQLLLQQLDTEAFLAQEQEAEQALRQQAGRRRREQSGAPGVSGTGSAREVQKETASDKPEAEVQPGSQQARRRRSRRSSQKGSETQRPSQRSERSERIREKDFEYRTERSSQRAAEKSGEQSQARRSRRRKPGDGGGRRKEQQVLQEEGSRKSQAEQGTAPRPELQVNSRKRRKPQATSQQRAHHKVGENEGSSHAPVQEVRRRRHKKEGAQG